MSTPPVLTVLEEWGLIICESCKHAVWPKNVAGHCGKQHGVDLVQAAAIAAIAAGYENDADLRHEPEELELPPFVETPVPFLPIYNGLACQVACRYVSITINSMLSHIKVAHRPAEQSTTATRLRQKQQAIGADTRRWRDTSCQRFFTNGATSSYFAVRSVPRGTVGRPPTPEPTTPHHPAKRARTDAGLDPFGRLMAHAAAGYETTLRDSRYEWADLLALTERPDPIEEPIASAVWTVTEELANIANETVRGAAVETRLQATRIRQTEQRVYALQAISDRRNVTNKNSRPPRYEFLPEQKQAWRRLVAAVSHPESAHGSDAENNNRDGSDDGTDKDSSDMSMRSDTSARPAPRKRRRGRLSSPGRDWSQAKMTRTHRACLDFCDGHVLPIAVGPYQDRAVPGSAKGDGYGRRKVGCPEMVARLMDRFMVRGTNGPMQQMVHLRSRCMQFNKQRTSEGRVQWDGDRVLYKDVGFDMDQLRGMVRDQIRQARQILTEELLLLRAGAGTPPPIPWGRLVDDPSNENVEWNFLKDRRVSWRVDGRSWLQDHVRADGGRQRQFTSTAAVAPRRQTREMTRHGATVRLYDPKETRRERVNGGANRWLAKQADSMPITAANAEQLMNEAGIGRYMKAVVSFREKLMLLSIRHTNTAGGRHRNVFVEKGYIAMATRYHKGNSATLSARIIHRYLPREVGELVVWYLWLVLPFQRQIEQLQWRGDTETAGAERGYIDNHMWPRDPGPEGREWTAAARLRRVVSGAFETAMRQRVGVQAYRHLAIAAGRKYLHGREIFRYKDTDREGDREDADVQAGEILDRQAVHMPDVAGRVYGGGAAGRGSGLSNAVPAVQPGVAQQGVGIHRARAGDNTDHGAKAGDTDQPPKAGGTDHGPKSGDNTELSSGADSGHGRVRGR
ncbi:Protein of unknown function (DUF3505) domain containing protein [Elaphomyces granulatus]